MDYAIHKACKREIIWVMTENGKKTMLDREPEKMWVFTLSGTWKMVDCYRSHFATCPQDKHLSGEKG